MLLETGEVLEPHHIKLAPRARTVADASLGQRIDAYLNNGLPTPASRSSRWSRNWSAP